MRLGNERHQFFQQRSLVLVDEGARAFHRVSLHDLQGLSDVLNAVECGAGVDQALLVHPLAVGLQLAKDTVIRLSACRGHSSLGGLSGR